MRIKIFLSPVSKVCRIPFNYQYSLSSSLYQLIYSVDEKYASELHNNGLKGEGGKPLKFFTFSYLFTPQKEIKDNRIIVNDHNICYFYLSSPLIDGFVKNVVIGLFEQKQINIYNENFHIIRVEPVPIPDFASEMNFKCMSPFVISTMREHNGSVKPHYYRPGDSGLSEAVNNNLLRKYRTLYQKEPQKKELQFALDQSYVQNRKLKKLTKLITLKEGHEKQETKIRGIFAPFRMTGSVELMKIAWDAGLGTHCSQGFGSIDILN
ncbi:MAG: CRISPR-associated endoribonuclease Cas6 [Candidatus Lokiarchaeota archaeon]|nr:CRISPR-associated endoribonuclease Cas6 [Candidatus Lokiarchaeota archaeon]